MMLEVLDSFDQFVKIGRSREEETCRKLLVVESCLFSLQLAFINEEDG